jgi:hypothetical protein
MYFKPSLIVVSKECKCMCMSYIIIDGHHGFEYFNEFINLCTLVDGCCIFVCIRHKYYINFQIEE